MIEITCEMCRDLMPLVQDGVASRDSKESVLAHIQTCPNCKSLFEGEIPSPTSPESVWKKFERKTRLFFAMVMMFGIFCGLMLTAGSGVFYNVLIMPIIGAIGYYLFRWKGLYVIPGLLFGTHLLTNAIGLGNEYMSLPGLLMWTAVYCGAAVLGLVIAALLHFAFQKEEDMR